MLLILSIFILTKVSLLQNSFCTADPVVAPEITTAPAKAYPFIVSMKKKTVVRDILWDATIYRHACGGSLITRKHVLTAAHCFRENTKIEDFKVTVGSNDLRNGKNYYIKFWLRYDEWATNNNVLGEYTGNDISIIELSNALDDKIQLARITRAASYDFGEKRIVTAGWGKINNGTMPRYLVEVELKVIRSKKCAYSIYAARNFTVPYVLENNKFCTNGNPYAILNCGDSGSPLLINGNEIIGINCSICPVDPDEREITGKEQNLHIDVRQYSDFIGALTDNCTIEDSKSGSSCWPFG